MIVKKNKNTKQNKNAMAAMYEGNSKLMKSISRAKRK